MDINSAEKAYLNESKELLEDMEAALLRLEAEGADSETLNEIFRAAHTIKGTGGVFGFTRVEAFTHIVENVLDRVRNDEVALDEALIALLLSCRDHIDVLVEKAVHRLEDDEDTISNGKDLTTRLAAYSNAVTETPDTDGGDGLDLAIVESGAAEVESIARVENDYWHISVRFNEDVLRHGLDPLPFIRYLGQYGQIVNVITILDFLPDPDDFDPESCYLGFEIVLDSEADKETLQECFEFIVDDCVLRILPPNTNIRDYIELIEAMECDNYKIGEILVKAGALTESELQEALRMQKALAESSGVGRDVTPPPIGEVVVDQKMIQKEVVESAAKQQSRMRANKGGSSVRVDAEKLDNLVNLVGEMVIAGASTNLLARSRGDSELMESISVLSRLVEEIRDSTLRLRMVPIGDSFNRFQRVVRDVSKDIGKDINLVINGGETELDKTVVEKIGDPLMHLIRNSMDHGIEPAEVRRACGKPEAGNVYLNAYHDSGNIVIEVADDGGGLDRDAILTKAVQNGLVDNEQALADQDVYRLIFEPGFSTASEVTNLSGRGVGMDVVRKNIESLRGTVDINSRPAEGTKITIRLPLTLAIIDGFLVSVSGSSFVIPLDMVMECIELTEETSRETNYQNYINLRDEVLPLLKLRDYFNLDESDSPRQNIVVIQSGSMKAGLVVDELLGEFQTVIKPLGRLFNNVNGISGATILGNGDVAIILDVIGLVNIVLEKEAHIGAKRSTDSAHRSIH